MGAVNRHLGMAILSAALTLSTVATSAAAMPATARRHDGSSALAFPAGIALGPGSVYVADSAHFRIVRFSWSGKFVAQWGSEGTGPGQFAPSGSVDPSTNAALGPTSIAVDRRGNVYVADTGNQRVEKFSSSGSFEAAWPINPADYIVREMAITVGPRGNLIVAMTGTSDCPDACSAYYILERLSPAGNPFSLWTSSPSDAPAGSGVSVIGHLAVASAMNGKVIVAATGAGDCDKPCLGFAYVQEWSADGHLLEKWNGPDQSWRPAALASGPHSLLYIAAADRAVIQRWTPSGTLLGDWGARGRAPGQFEEPSGVAVDRRGNIWVADAGNGRIQKLSPSGRPLEAWSGVR